jgi:hypothetical protein
MNLCLNDDCACAQKLGIFLRVDLTVHEPQRSIVIDIRRKGLSACLNYIVASATVVLHDNASCL